MQMKPQALENVIAMVAHIPRTSRKTGFSFQKPFKKSLRTLTDL